MSGLTRRDLLLSGAVVGGVALAAREAKAQHEGHDHPPPAPDKPPDKPPAEKQLAKPRPAPKGWQDAGTVITPNGVRMPWKVVDGVKVFHIVAEPVAHTMVEGLDIEAWGYNGRTPGPTIEVIEGDRCRFYVTNRLPEATSVHWHGVLLPNGMDGVSGLTQRAIAPGETFAYEFTFTKAGTFMYHPHFDEMTQIALGMQGMIVVHPKRRNDKRVRDYALLLNQWKITAGTRRPNPMAMNDFNMLTFNSKAFPSTEPVLAELGDLIRLRIANISPMDHHPIHLHGHALEIVETDGGPVPKSARRPETTAFVPVGSIRVVEFRADALGDWPLHCHMTHHVMNQMGHAGPPLIGADLSDADLRIRKIVPGYMTMGHTGMGEMGEMGMPMPKNSVPMLGKRGPFGYIDMGGMFTIVKIRERLSGNEDPGWYQHPTGTVASPASAAQLQRDGIDVEAE
jgi:FtsP/CotA-like multicopper oxidase with cupredoxin domain